jgi:hypothetical protein
MPSITPGTFLEVGRTMIQNLAWPMSILMPIAILSTLPVLFLLFRRKATTAFYVACTGLLLFVVALVITLGVNVPIDNQMRQWTVASLPSDWKAIRDRWESYHSIGTFASLGGLGCAAASALMFNDTTKEDGGHVHPRHDLRR